MVSFKITGLDQVGKQLKELSDAGAALNGKICDSKFNPADSSDVQRAIRDMENEIDRRVSRWRNNQAVQKLASETKANLRKQILERARTAKR